MYHTGQNENCPPSLLIKMAEYMARNIDADDGRDSANILPAKRILRCIMFNDALSKEFRDGFWKKYKGIDDWEFPLPKKKSRREINAIRTCQ